MIASQLGHRDLRMTKRYARIASAQVRQAVNGLDPLLSVTQEPETEQVVRSFAAEKKKILPQTEPVRVLN